MASPGFKANPYPFYARLRAEAPVYRVRLSAWLEAWFVTRYDDVVTVLKDARFAKDFSTKLPWLPGFARPLVRNLMGLDPPDHTRLRALVNKVFTAGVVDRLRDGIRSKCDELLDAGAAKGRMDLVHGLALPLPLAVVADMLGIPQQDRKKFDSWAQHVSTSTSGAIPDMLRAMPYMWLFVRYFRKLIALRRAEPRDDLVTALVAAEEAGEKLNEEELIGLVYLLLLAGYDTVMNLISSGALTLIQHPRQRELLQRDASLAESAIEELLRYTSPVEVASPRVAREDVRLGSVTIPRGAVVFAVLGSANRDESRFPDPDRLDIARTPNKHLALGGGAHFCLGAPLARLEGQIVLTALFRRFPDLRLAVAPESLRWRRGLTFRGLTELPVILDAPGS